MVANPSFSEIGIVFASDFASALKQTQSKTITSSSSRRIGNVGKQESSFVRMSLREILERKRGPSKELFGG
jgi:hypothetical protein